ncbi:hypothetical protein [Sandarakinorhabdus sp.]|jgi:hypothetical protein|uniref:hypothetical protein n=1 Tax=Sandarakinorhabdus sp. TaxID=1916663 RepID=UPI0028ABC545|nr:hypothetical protein [Sandarakinorhabdus sp.]
MNDPFDRSDIGESSLAATERLRARLMAPGPARAQQTARRGGFAWAIAAALFAFAAGLIANPWFEQAVRGRLPFVVAASSGEADALEKRLAALERARGAAPVVPSERLARTEAKVESSTDQIQRDAERIDELNRQFARLAERLAATEARDASVVAAAQGAADRAESMLTVLLLRRAVEDGRSLDALLPATRRLFGEQYADEVAALEALSAAPATRLQLARQLAGLSDAGPGSTRPDWWQAFMRRVETTFSASEGAGPVAQAQGLMARGNVAAAAAALRRSTALRGNATVRGWLAAADRLLAGETALVALEAAAAAPLPAPVAVTAPTR